MDAPAQDHRRAAAATWLKRPALFTAILAVILAGLLRWEQWQCTDGRGGVVAESGGLLWPWQHPQPPLAPAGGTRLVHRRWQLLPPKFQTFERVVPPAIVPGGDDGAEPARRN